MIDKIIKAVTIIFFILLPVFYLSVTADSYEYNKMAFLFVSVLILFLLTALEICQKRQLRFVKNTFFPPFLFLTVMYLISTFFQSPNLALPFSTPLSTSTIICGFLLFIFLVYNLEKEFITSLISFLVIDACFISVFIILQKSAILPDNSYTPAGTLLSTATFLSIISVYLLMKIINTVISKGSKQPQDPQVLILHFLAFLLITGTTVFLAVQLTTTAKPIILPFSFGWKIFLETLKNIQTLFLGIGPTNFVTAFSLTKPIEFNLTPFWNTVFFSSSSFFLNLATEVGLLAGLLYIIILLKLPKLLKSLKEKAIVGTLLYTLLLLIFLPASMTVFVAMIIFLAAAGKNETARTFNFKKIGFASYLFLIPVILTVVGAAYFGEKFYFAEVLFKQSLNAVVSGAGERAYTLQNQAISINPDIDRYHTAFSRTNLALANAIAAKSELTDVDKQNIPNLVKQAIDEARTAVVLNRTNELNWDNLGRVYSAISGYAQGAENWAAYSFQQKLILDPTNPNTYLALVGINLQVKNYPQAEDLARRAITLKPDLANSHYYLNLALQGQKKYKEAYDELQATSRLLGTNSADSQKVAEELKSLTKLLPATEATGSTNINDNAAPNQTLEIQLSSPSAIQNLPEGIPTISLPNPNE